MLDSLQQIHLLVAFEKLKVSWDEAKPRLGGIVKAPTARCAKEHLAVSMEGIFNIQKVVTLVWFELRRHLVRALQLKDEKVHAL